MQGISATLSRFRTLLQKYHAQATADWVAAFEDACRIRKSQGAQTFSVLRPIALNRLKQID